MSPGPYHVLASRQVTERFQALLERAQVLGRYVEFVQAADRIMTRLCAAPAEFGEERDPYPALNLTHRIAFDPPLIVDFAINDSLRIVWIRELRAIPGRGL